MNISPVVPEIKTADYDYNLPEALIAFHALEKRDEAKLMVVDKDNFRHKQYVDLPNIVPSNAHLVFNNTRVIAARLNFTTSHHAAIEIFLLEPSGGDYSSLHATSKCTWKCLIGGARKWKSNEKLIKLFSHKSMQIKLEATLNNRLQDHFNVEFNWTSDMKFHEIIELAGKTPLPPYIKREATIHDAARYQTVYAKEEGSVAAPTAGLHFTEELIERLHQQGICSSQVTLHVGAGTFKPVTSSTIAEHTMHKEFFEVSTKTLESFAEKDKNIIPVGTTSLRTIESLYWIGLKIYNGISALQPMNNLEQWEHFHLRKMNMPNATTVFNHLAETMHKNNVKVLHGRTGICITPGYSFTVAKGLITNFHQPQSTLLLIIAAILGDRWKKMYEEAIEKEYRFLSYGDGSLLFIEN